jgi:carbon monoxide dehydrogenase subunit G
VQLEHSFTVPVGIDDAWRVLLDIELIAPCMPGAAIDSVDGDDFTGTVKVKLGPIGLTYKGKASFIEKNETAHRAVIDARGRDARGNGTANAKVTATLTESSGSTRVDVLTDLDITGKPAQFGRGVMVDVGNKLIGQFADCLAGKLTDGASPVADPAAESSAPPKPAIVASDGADGADGAADRPKPTARPRKTPAKAATKTAAKTTAKAPAKAPSKATAKAAENTTAKAAAKAAKAPAKSAAKATAAAAAATPATTKTSTRAAVPDAVPEASTPAETARTAPQSAASTPTPRLAPQPGRPPAEVEPINLIESAGPAVLKRLLPVIVAVLLALWALRRRQHR